MNPRPPMRRLLALVALLLSTMNAPALAVPSFARQMGVQCAACHVSFPELTPFGRTFKLSGYTLGTRQTLPLAMMAQLSRTSVRNNDDGTGTATPATARDGQAALNGVSLFLAGKVTDHLGGFVQWTHSRSYNTDGTSQGHSALDNADLRWTNRLDGKDMSLLYGITVHNNPTVQDVWNSTPAFGYPYTTSGTAVGPTAALQIERLAQQVVGTGAYGFLNGTWYGELTAYRTADGPFSILRAGYDPLAAARLKGYNPYVRLAWNKDWGSQSVMFGAFALRVATYSVPTDPGSPVDRFTDKGIDAQYQYIGDPHVFTTQASYIREHQDYRDSFAVNGTNPTDSLSKFKLKATYYYDRKYGLTVSHFRINGSSDAGLYAAGAVSGSAKHNPGSTGNVFELDYLPTENLRLMLQYTAYSRFNGGSGAGYDGVTNRRPGDNNAMFLNLWLAY